MAITWGQYYNGFSLDTIYKATDTAKKIKDEKL